MMKLYLNNQRNEIEAKRKKIHAKSLQLNIKAIYIFWICSHES